MALAPPERLTDSRPRSMSKLAESPAGLVPAPLISGRMMTPTKPQSAGLGGGSSTAASGVRRRPGSRGVKKEAYVDPSVSQALAAALKAELALAEFDATPEIFGEILPLQVPVLIGGGGGNSSGGGGYHPSFQLQQQQQPHSQHNNGGTPKHHDRHHHHNHHHHPNHNHHHHNNHHHNHHHHNHHPNNTPTPQPPPPPPQPYVPTPENIRARAEKAAEFEVEHNWLLKEEAEIKVKKFDATKRKLAIFLPDDDPLEGISNRLEEIQSMVKPKAELSNFLEDLSTDQRDKILQVADADTEELIKDRRQNWKSADIIRNTFRMIYIMVCQCHPGRRYFNPDDPEAGPAIMRRQRKIYGQGKAPIKSSLSEDMQLSLTKHPAYRTPHDIKRVMWVLRATKAFKHLFPTEMEREVAKVVGYERYDDNRHLAYQGRSSTRFYYVLSGRIQQLKEYRLTSGCVNKSMGIWNKGMTSDPEELEQGWYRESHLVSKGPVEVLILDKDDFIRLQHTVQGPPVDFLWSIDLFKEFPCDDFHDNPDAIEFKYYGQNRIVARDINRTPWLHVVKSGIVKVVRVQYVFDVRNEKKFSTQSTEELGCGRSFSHAQAMLGLLAKQRRMKTLTASEICLPDLFQRRSLMSVEDGRRGKRRKSHFLQQLSQKSASIAGDVPVIFVEDTKVDMGEDSGSTPSHSGKQKSSDLVLPPIVQSGREPTFSASSSAQLRGNAQAHGPSSAKPSQASNTNDDDDDADNNDNDDDERTSGAAQEHKGAGPENTQSVSSAGSKRAGSGAMPRMTEAPLLVPHGTFLTREKTVPDTHTHLIPPGVVFGKKEKKDALVRKAYLQLDLLKPGDVFGLDDLAQKLRFNKNEIEEDVEGLGLRLPPGVYPKDLGLENLDHPAIPMNEGPAISLVSDGAEVIKISKRFFLQHAQNNTMLRVETMQRSYLSTDEAKSILYDKETWAQYKHVLMQRLIDGLPR